MHFEKRWLWLVMVVVGWAVGPLGAGAQDLDELMSDSSDGKPDQRASQETEDRSDDRSTEPDPWERPPADPEPTPKPKAQAAPVVTNPPDGRRIQIGLQLGYGFETEKPAYFVHPYGLGLGLQGGYTFDFGLFLGLSTNYYFGNSGEDYGNVNTWLLGVEAGYDWWVTDGALLRPSAQIGFNGTFRETDTALDGGRSFWGVYLAPGIALQFPFADAFYVGGDLRLPIALSNGNGAFSLALTGGLRL